MHSHSPDFHRILISRMKFIGDVVLTTPIIRSVREAYPDAYIAYLGEKSAVSLLGHNPHLNEIIPFDFSRPTILEQPRVILHLRRRRFDLAIDLFGNPRSALLMYLSGTPARVGQGHKGRGRLYTILVSDDGRPKTAVQFHQQFLRAVGIPSTASQTEIFLTDDERRQARGVLAGYARTAPGGPLVALQVGATWPAKRWLADRFAQLADRVATELGGSVILTGGPADQEIVQQVRQLSHSAPIIVGVLPIRRLAALLAECAVVVSNDAGPMHVAVAVGTPTVGLFGPGEENIWFPYSSAHGHVALRKNVACHPCHLDVCNRTGGGYMECMHLLGVDEVVDAVSTVLHIPRPPVVR
jgi:lipopolysaccharide heptosyltransferase II